MGDLNISGLIGANPYGRSRLFSGEVSNLPMAHPSGAEYEASVREHNRATARDPVFGAGAAAMRTPILPETDTEV